MVSLTAAWLACLFAVVLANSMTKPPGRDEQMYCTAGALVAKGMLPYRDFSYAAQLPYHPFLLAGIYRLIGTSHYLLAGRLFSVACDMIVVILLVAWYGRISRVGGLVLGLAAGTIYVIHPVVCYANGYAWNHDLVQAAVAAALFMVLSTEGSGTQAILRPMCAGLLLGLAVFSRITTILVLPVFIIWLLSDRSTPFRTRLVGMLLFAAGLTASAALPVWVIMQAPGAVWLELVEIPRLYGQWLGLLGMTLPRTRLALRCLLLPENLLILGILVLSGIWMWRSSLRQWICLALAMVFCIVAFIPPTMWLQYWAIPVPFMLMGLAEPVSRLADKRPALRVLAWVLTLGLLIRNWDQVDAVRSLVVPDQWVPIRVHWQYSQLLADIGPGGRVLTIAPLWALEADRQIYRELSCGPIIYRIADQLTEDQRRLANVVGPGSLRSLILDKPPDAVLVGVEDPRFAFLETPLLSAVGPNWSSRSTADGATVWFASNRP